jgi:hypothetical protein
MHSFYFFQVTVEDTTLLYEDIEVKLGRENQLRDELLNKDIIIEKLKQRLEIEIKKNAILNELMIKKEEEGHQNDQKKQIQIPIQFSSVTASDNSICGSASIPMMNSLTMLVCILHDY